MSKPRRTERELFPGSGATIGTRSRHGDLGSDKIRTDFQRDVHRIIYSQAFRRLRHKTQVFFFPRNDHVCTRMEHVLHVASAARTVARSLGLNEDLAEAIGLGHDIGHAPFGHEGEKILTEIIAGDKALNAVVPEFSHEINSLRVVDKIAKLDREPPGLKLTWEVRDGIVSHWGEDRITRTLKPHKGDKDLDNIKRRKDAGNPATLEECIVRLIDKIVYVGRDIEDAITTGVVSSEDIPRDIFAVLGSNNGEIVGTFLEDMVENSGQQHISISEGKAELLHELIDFNDEHIYHSEAAERNKKQARYALKFIFDELTQLVTLTRRFTKNGNKTNVSRVLRQFVTEDMKGRYGDRDPDSLIVLDFIAGMTDNFAVSAYIELSVPQATV